MANLVTAKGIVLKQTDYGEANRMLTIFTDEYGIIKAAAHGAKRTKSRQSASTQFLTYAEFSFYAGNSDVWSISSAQTIDSFFPIHEDISKLSIATYFSELTFACLDLQNPDTEILRLLLNTLYAMAYKNVSPAIAKPVFELRCIALAGFEPVVDYCISCGAGENLTAFSVTDGGSVCRNCAKKHDFAMHDSTRRMAQFILRALPNKIYSFVVDEPVARQASHIFEKYAALMLDYEFQSLEYYKKIEGIK